MHSTNGLISRALSILFGSPFRILRLSHLLHHKLNRSLMEATEPYEPSKAPWAGAALGYYFQIFGGLYLGESVSLVLFLLPKGVLLSFKARFVRPDSVSGILLQTGRKMKRSVRFVSKAL